jgi:hypothetical protein
MTSRTFAAGWLVAAAVLSSWAVSSAADQPRQAVTASRPAAPRALPDVSADVEAQVDRLVAFMHAPAPAVPPSRNLFEFEGARRGAGMRPAGAAARTEAPAVIEAALETAAPAAEAAAPALSAIAEVAGAHTAVISFDETLHYVKLGDVIAGRYRIDAVRVDGVDIFDLTRGTILRLTLLTVT